VPAYPDETFTGSIAAIAPAVDQKTRSASVRIAPQDPAGKLRPGMLATVSIVTGTKSDALLIPREAVVGTPTPNAAATVVAVSDQRAQRLAVKLGLVSDQLVEVVSGLAEGQVVATANANGLKTGDAVVPELRTAQVVTGVE
jgi:RND family efflux transporter MFP subunit